MSKHFLKSGKIFANVACSPLILISNNSELAAKYIPNDNEQVITTLEIENINNGLFQRFDINQENNLLLAENEENIEQERVLISEIIIEGGKIILRVENSNWLLMIL